MGRNPERKKGFIEEMSNENTGERRVADGGASGSRVRVQVQPLGSACCV